MRENANVWSLAMPTLTAVETAAASGKAKALLDFILQRTNRIPNMIGLLANSPPMLDAYLHFAGAFREASLDEDVQALIAIAVASACGCDYTLSAVTTIARRDGLSDDDRADARDARARAPKTAAALAFAADMVRGRGQIGGEHVHALKAVGYSDAEVVEIVGAVALNLFRCYFNLIAQPELDFPLVRATGPAVA
jgi:AhpD family alkylhydroperoxidase